eukprot:m.339058 g.339058  ORF g.339058 m.339058 type:complete len:371 (+) comp27808_c0_seq6:2446-3558(+)
MGTAASKSEKKRVKFDHMSPAQRAMARRIYDDHEAVLLSVPTDEVKLLSTVTHKPNKAGRLSVCLDGSTMLDTIPAEYGEFRTALEQAGEGVETSVGDMEYVLSNTSAIAATLGVDLGDASASITAEIDSGNYAAAKLCGVSTRRLDCSAGELTNNVKGLPYFNVSIYEGQKYLTFVTRVFYAKSLEMTFKDVASSAFAASIVALRAKIKGGRVSTAGNSVTITSDEGATPMVFAVRLLRVKVVPVGASDADHPTRARFEVDRDTTRLAAGITGSTVDMSSIDLNVFDDPRLARRALVGHDGAGLVPHFADAMMDEEVVELIDDYKKIFWLDLEEQEADYTVGSIGLVVWTAVMGVGVALIAAAFHRYQR